MLKRPTGLWSSRGYLVGGRQLFCKSVWLASRSRGQSLERLFGAFSWLEAGRKAQVEATGREETGWC